MAQFAIDEILTTGIAISGFVFDVSNNIGVNGYVLASTSSGVMWQQDSSNADLSSLSGQIAATGTLLNNRINSLSGYADNTFLSGSGTQYYVPRWNTARELVTGSIYDLVTGIGIGTTSPAAKLEVKGADDAVITAIFQSFAGNPAYNGGIQLGNAVANQNSQIYHSSAGDNTLTFVSNYAGGTANKFIFAPGGTETVRFQQNGRVGIGFQTPTETLDVSGRVRAIGEAFTLNAATLTDSQTSIALSRLGAITDQKYWEILSYNAAANGDFVIRTINDAYSNAAEGMRIVRGSSYNIASVLFPNGKVGIGTNSPTTLLSVGPLGSTTAASGITFGGDAQANLYRYTEDTLKTDGALIAGTYLRALNYVQLLTNLYPDSYTDYLRLNVGNSAGNAWENYPVVIKRGVYVGIGTDTPSGKLHVVSSIVGETVLRADGTNGTLFSVTDDLSDSLMSVNNSAGLPVFEVFADDRVVAGQYGSGDFVLVNNKVGIGTTNPTYKLHVLGDTLISGNLTNPTIIGLSGALNITGSTLDTKINTLSGYSNANFATITNLAATGSTLDTKINTTNTNLAATGSTLDARINSLSGYANNTFISGVGVANYVARWSNTKELLTGSIYDLGTGIGIGTTSPAAKFNVYGGNTVFRNDVVGGTSAVFIRNWASSPSTSLIFGNTTNDDSSTTLDLTDNVFSITNYGEPGSSIKFGTRNNSTADIRVTIDPSGRVGIGATNLSSLLTVGGAGSTNSFSGISFGQDSQANLYRISSSRIKTDGNFTIDGQGGGATSLVLNRSSTSSENGMAFYTAGSTDWYFYVDNGNNNLQIQRSSEIDSAPRVRFDGANSNVLFNLGGGDVGIGTTQPGGRLHVSGSDGHVLYLNQGITGAQGGLYLQNVDQFALSSARLYFISGDSILFTRGASNLAWAVSQNANVGIGVTNPSEKLTITGAVKILTRDGANFKVGDGSNNNTFLEFDYPDITTSSAHFRIFRSTNTVGGKYFQIFKGDGTATSQTLLNANGDSHINAIAGNLGIGTDSPNHLLNLSTVTSDTSIGLYTTTSNTSARNWLISANDLAYGDFSLRQSLAISGNPRISGVSRFYITNNGNVGVGTVNPSYNLDVIGTVRASGELISEGNNARISLFRLGGINYFDWASGQSLYFSTESSVGGAGRNTVMSITSGGNVGVGTVNAVAPIHIGGNASNNDPWMVLDINDTYFKRIIFSEDRSAYGTTGYGGYIGYDADNNVVSLGVYENSTQNRVLNIRRENGNVGIGTTSPNTLLNVHGADPFVRINNTSTNDQGIKISYNNSDTHGLHLLYNANSAVSYIDNTYPVLSTFVYGDIYFRQNVAGTMTTRMTIKADGGNVGIGTTSPVGKLTVQGNIEVNYNSITADSFVRRSFLTPHAAINRGSNIAFGIVDGGGLAGMTVYNTASSVAGYNSQFIGFNTHEGNVSTDERMRITQSGYVGIGTFAPLTLLSVGTEGSTSAVNGLTFGGDAQVNLYRSAENVLKTDGSLIITDSLGLGISPTQKLQVDGVVGNPALNGTTQSGIFRISNTTDNAVLDFGIRAGGLGAWIQSTDETSLSATYPLLLNPNGGSVGIGITNPSGQLHLRNMGFTNQDTVPDTNLFPNASGVFGLVMDHDTYTNGLYRHRFIKVDRSANIPLYLQQAGSVAHQYINLVRFGTHSQSTDTFEVFGDSRINGSVNVTSTLSTSGSINIGTDLYVSGQLGVGVPIANKRLNYGAEIKANNFSIQLVLGRIGAVSGLGAIGADANNTFAVWNVSGQTTRQFVVTQQGNVGIGSASPVSRLDVNGTIALSGYSFADRFAVYNRVWNPELPSIYLGDSSDPTNYYDNTTHIFRARGAGAERMRITTAGNVGIGSESPTQKLDVSGTLKIKSAGTYSDPTDNAGFLNYDTVGGIFTLSARSNAGNTYMAFRTSNGGTGSEKVRITNNGLVGISSNAPTDFLDFGGAGKNIVFGYAAYGEVLNSAASIIGNNVKASPTANSQVRRFASANDQGNFIKLIYNKGVTFHTNITSALNTDISEDTNERMRIDLSGNVGIGTTGPTFKLSVQGIAQARGGVYVTQATPTNTLVLDADSTSLHKIYTNSTVDLSLGTNSSTTQVYLKDGGNVGIGTTDPTNKLQVVGQIAIKGDESADNAKMYFQASDNSNRYTVETDLDGDTNNDLLIFRSNTVDNMLVLKGNGNVGIGVANPACKLDVAGTIRSSTNEIYGFGASDNVSLRAASTLNVLGIYTSNVERLRLAANGYFGVGTDNPSTLLSVGRAGSTLPASGLTFGGDAEANLYRSAEDTIKTDGSLIVAGNVTATNLVSGNGTANYITKWNGTKSIANSQIFDDGTYVGVNTAVNTTYRLQVNGSFAATTKSFDIVHPTISGKRLIYASLEGPENGVYFRGKNDNNEINLPHYWSGLVHDDSITVDLTSVGKRKDGKIRNYTVDQIGHNKVYIYTDSDDNIYDYYYTIFAERRDVSRLITERDME